MELGGYLYVNADPPIALSTERFAVDEPTQDSPVTVPPFVDLSAATIVFGTSTERYGATLEFSSVQDAESAWLLFRQSGDRPDTWGKLEVSRVFLVKGAGSWAGSARGALDSDGLVSLRDHDPSAWSIITNLPERPPSRPMAAGMLKLDGTLIESLGAKAGISLDGIGDAFAAVRVETLGFGVYANKPITVSDSLDRNALTESGTGVLLVAQSGYPGFAVSFMLGIAAGRIGMETVELGDSSVRYRTKDDLHLIITNKGKILFAALAGSKDDAENLMLSAISD